jgi:hypothetical protein
LSIGSGAALVLALAAWCKTSTDLRMENLALRQQLAVLHRSAPKRAPLTKMDRAFWVRVKRVWGRGDELLMIVKPDTVFARASC